MRYWTGLFVVVVVGIGVARWQGDDVPVDGAEDGAASVASGVDPHDAPGPVLDAGPDIAPDAVVARPEAVPEATPEPDADGGPVTRWSRVVGPGESLAALLAEAGLDPVTRRQVSQALGEEFELRRLQPGHALALELGADGSPRRAELEIDDGVRIRALFGDAPSVRVVPPDLDSVRLAGAAEIGSSIYAALETAGIPTRFATDLELVLAGTLDLRRVLAGGERLRVAWRENRLEDRAIGEPLIDFAQLDLGGDRYEVLWPGARSLRTRIYKNGVLLRTFDQPIAGARLSSAFGPRKHPIHNIVRMHSGVDFEAPLGADVLATQAGRIVYMGKKSGYGLMVEIDHGGGVHTLYAHLSETNDALRDGQRVAAGDAVGRVGSTGTSTAPHLHYEIVVDGKPVQPLTDERLLGADASETASALAELEQARQDVRLLARDAPGAAGNEG
ncbi:M23 family metallopeptidase [Citreimonas salinaria]|uniref:M23 family metallopeptidase n=1 Tax=Citreimonas salinaria TaxID=321339 RepID=UPI001FE0C9AC|nr:M23 family metallopeptidase [Citreimonas salinaria]